MSGRKGAFSGWRMVAICALAQNVAMGLGYGSFGPLLLSNEQYFGISRTSASMGMSILSLTIGVLAPFVGGLLLRVSLRSAMIGAAIASAAAYGVLALSPSYALALVAYAVIGAGLCILAILGPVTLTNRWFATDRGKILALINMPIVLLLGPIAIGAVLPHIGRSMVLGAMGVLFIALLPLLFLVIDSPAQVGQVRRGEADEGDTPLAVAAGADMASSSTILRSPSFWLLSFGIGTMSGTGTAVMVHLVPFGVATGMPLVEAAGLISIYAAAGIGGNFFFGWLADRITGVAALILSAFLQSALWLVILHASGPLLFVGAGLLGACVIPLVTLHGASLSELFGAASISRAMGISYTIKLPFLFGFAPGVAVLFNVGGSYELPFLTMSAAMSAAGLCFLYVLMATRGRARSSLRAAAAARA